MFFECLIFTVHTLFQQFSSHSFCRSPLVSLTSVVCQIFESIIRDHIMKHFSLHKLFSDRQFGFINGR
jgi:hypothetical protein